MVPVIPKRGVSIFASLDAEGVALGVKQAVNITRCRTVITKLSSRTKDLDFFIKGKEMPKSKMYQDFFERKPSEAAVWRPPSLAESEPVAPEELKLPTPSSIRTNNRCITSDQTFPVLEDLRYRTKNVECVVDIGSAKQETKKEIPKCQMYMNFFKRKPTRAAVWRSLPPLSADEMNLNQKAEAITAKISTDFINWLGELGGEDDLSLTVENVMKMFEIGFDRNYSKSIKVDIKELPSVPRKVAEMTRVPQFGRRAVLRREIRRDMKASKKKTTCSAFGSQLPFDMQVRPPAENYFKKWTSCDKIPEKLASMATVWEGIENLRSTQAFCQFLRTEKPDVKPPKYLQKCGMMSMKKQKKKPKYEVSLLFDHDNSNE